MKRCLVLLLGIFLVLNAKAGAVELEYGKVYTPESGMPADEIMQITYHNKYSLFAEDYDLPNSYVFYIDKSGFTRKKEAIRKRIVLNGRDGLSYKDLISVTYPTQAKGLAILTWTYENPERDQDVWLWVPALKKVRKVSASEDDDAFMGSDLTVEEVSTRRFEDENYKLIGEKEFDGYKFEHSGEMKLEARPCFVIEAVPNKPHWYYDKRIVWIDKEIGGAIFEEYYDKNGKLFKTIFREWDFYKPETKHYPQQVAIECKDLRVGHRTVIINENEEYDQGANEQDFTVKSLMRTRW